MERKPPKKAVEELSRLIWRLEAWQNRYDVGHIDTGYSTQAKSELMSLETKLREARGEE